MRPMPLTSRDRTGERYGTLLVIQPSGDNYMRPSVISGQLKRGERRWVCKCDCGSEVTLTTGSLNRSKNYDYCLHGTRRKQRKPGAARIRALREYQRSAQRRDYAWGLTDEEFFQLVSLDCFYCGGSPSTVKRTGPYEDFIYNGLDRMDNTLGYTLENVVTSCRTCNLAKRDMSFEDFIAYLDRITEHRSRRRDLVCAGESA